MANTKDYHRFVCTGDLNLLWTDGQNSATPNYCLASGITFGPLDLSNGSLWGTLAVNQYKVLQANFNSYQQWRMPKVTCRYIPRWTNTTPNIIGSSDISAATSVSGITSQYPNWAPYTNTGVINYQAIRYIQQKEIRMYADSEDISVTNNNVDEWYRVGQADGCIDGVSDQPMSITITPKIMNIVQMITNIPTVPTQSKANDAQSSGFPTTAGVNGQSGNIMPMEPAWLATRLTDQGSGTPTTVLNLDPRMNALKIYVYDTFADANPPGSPPINYSTQPYIIGRLRFNMEFEFQKWEFRDWLNFLTLQDNTLITGEDFLYAAHKKFGQFPYLALGQGMMDKSIQLQANQVKRKLQRIEDELGITERDRKAKEEEEFLILENLKKKKAQKTPDSANQQKSSASSPSYKGLGIF